MFHNFQEMEDYIKSQNIKKRLVLANAHDEDVLEAVVTARKRGVIEPILIGKEDKGAAGRNGGSGRRLPYYSLPG